MHTTDRFNLETGEEALEEASRDFGRVFERRPRAVARPHSVQDVVEIIRASNTERMPVTLQGGGHSQSGHSLSEGGILVDMKGLDRIGDIEGDEIRVQGGVRWRDLVRRVYAEGYLPPALTTHLSVTVGGTLSMAGLSITSHRYGLQTDNVTELEVVTGDGRLVRCSPESHCSLFDCVRCGLGQFGAIVGARMRLRRVLPKVRTFTLLYEDVGVLMQDLEMIAGAERFQYIDGWCLPVARDPWQVLSGELFAYRVYAVYLSSEWDDTPPDEDELLGDLNYTRMAGFQDYSTLRFVTRAENSSMSYGRLGDGAEPGSGGLNWFDDWGQAHPCTEGVLPWSAFPSFITEVVDQLPGPVARTARIMLGPFCCKHFTSPLFMHPDEEMIMGYGILIETPPEELDEVLPILATESRRIIDAGGKRYLSGWLDFDDQGWRDHYGDRWPQMLEWKREFDPRGVLNPGVMPLSPDSALGDVA